MEEVRLPLFSLGLVEGDDLVCCGCMPVRQTKMYISKSGELRRWSFSKGAKNLGAPSRSRLISRVLQGVGNDLHRFNSIFDLSGVDMSKMGKENRPPYIYEIEAIEHALAIAKHAPFFSYQREAEVS